MPKSICDFAAGTGGAFISLKQTFKNSFLIATEGSEEYNKTKNIGYDSVSKAMLVRFGMKKY